MSPAPTGPAGDASGSTGRPDSMGESGPTASGGPRVALAVARAEVRRYYHRHAATRRKRALLLVGLVAFLPLWGGLVLIAFTLGSSVADGGLDGLVHVARWWFPVAFGMFALQGAFVTTHLLEFEARDLLLATVPDRTLALGLLVATCWNLGTFTLVPVGALFAAFGYGTGSLAAAAVGVAAAAVLLLASFLAGTALGLAARVALFRVPLTADARSLYGSVTKVGVMVGFGAVGAVGGARLGDVEDANLGPSTLAPSGPPPLPGYAADWLFVATPLTEVTPAAVVAGLGAVATIPATGWAITELAPRLWYADPATPDAEAAAGATETAGRSFLADGRLPAAGRTGVVVDGLVRRLRRQPARLVFVAYYLFVPVVLGASLLAAGEAGPAAVAGGSLVAVGLWLAGGAFCLNPLGEEGSMLGQVLLSETPPHTFVRARLLAGVLVGVGLVAGGTVLLAVDALPPRRALAYGAWWLALVPASAGLALGLGTLLPGTGTRRLLDAIEVRAPQTWAILAHAVVVAALGLAGPALARSSADATLQASLAAALALAAVVAGHGGYRFALAELAGQGRKRDPDPVFAAELAVGLSLGGLVLSTSGGLGVVVVLGFEGLAGFVAAFLGSYLGWAAVVAAYLLAGPGPDYLDVRVPTRGDRRAVAVGTAGLLGLWAAVTAGVQLFDLPVTRHSLSGAIGAGGPELVLALVALAVLVNGPVEEVLFRNVVQKRLGEAVDRRTALAGASVLFAAVHVPVYAGGGVGGLATALALLSALGAVLGVLYDRTGSVVVPALCHGLYNAALFLVVYGAV